MARPPATSTAPNALAAYMRAFRAWKSGRGSKPAGRAQFVAEFETDYAEMMRSVDRADYGDDHERGWADLRDAILDLGGVRSTVDFGYQAIPPAVYRTTGLAPDMMAELLAEYHGFYFEDGNGLLTGLWHAVDALRRHREAA